jgi:hypothetical protein
MGQFQRMRKIATLMIVHCTEVDQNVRLQEELIFNGVVDLVSATAVNLRNIMVDLCAAVVLGNGRLRAFRSPFY